MKEIYESVTEAVLAVVNQFPGLAEGERFAFASLGEDGGLALYPGEGDVTEEESHYVTGRVRRICRLPFSLIYRAAGVREQRREDIAAWMDALGRWLEGQTVAWGGRYHCLAAYPALTDGRRLVRIRRCGTPKKQQIQADRTESWVMAMSARYENIFYK